jgi:hypothetical protein
LREASYLLAGGSSTRLRLRISARLARQILGGLRQRRKVRMSLTGVATHPGAPSRSIRIRIQLKR